MKTSHLLSPLVALSLCTPLFALDILPKENLGAEAAPVTPLVKATPQQIQTALAAHKAILLMRVFQEENKTPKTAPQYLSLCADFAEQEGAPQALVDIFRYHAPLYKREDKELMYESMNQFVKDNHINLDLINAWAYSTDLQAEELLPLLKGEEGTKLYLAETLPPTEKDLLARPEEEVQKESNIMKLALLDLFITNRENKHRISQEQRLACLAKAKKGGAPSFFTRYLAAENNTEIAAKTRSYIKGLAESLLLAYHIDRASIRLFAETSQLSVAQVEQLVKENEFFLSYIFNALERRGGRYTTPELSATALQWENMLNDLTQELSKISAETPEAENKELLFSPIESFLATRALLQGRDNGFVAQVDSNRLLSLRRAYADTQKELARLMKEKDQLPLWLQAYLYLFA